MRSLVILIVVYTLIAATVSCNPDRASNRPYTIGLMALGKTSKLTRQMAAQSCRNLLNDSVRNVTITWLADSISPQVAYYEPRDRYRAEIILKEVSKVRRRLGRDLDAVILVTDQPISTSVHGVYDYGICGLSGLGTGASVVSAHHLDKQMFCQTLRHEWGHGTGLPHCREVQCIMNDASGKISNLQGHAHFGKQCYARAAKKYR